jgi:hypothetical protein
MTGIVILKNTLKNSIKAASLFDQPLRVMTVPKVIISSPMENWEAIAATRKLAAMDVPAYYYPAEMFAEDPTPEQIREFGSLHVCRADGNTYTLLGSFGKTRLFERTTAVFGKQPWFTCTRATLESLFISYEDYQNLLARGRTAEMPHQASVMA